MLKNYDGAKVTFVWGNIVATGLADGSWVTVARDEDGSSLYIGTDGSGTRAKSNNFAGTITVRLAQSSETNDAYSAQYALAEAGTGGAGVYPAMLRDNSGRTLVQAQSCWIQKLPDAEFGREATEREWVFRTDRLIMSVGGN